MPKIYDCFSVFNELDLLQLRLEELDSVVDHFVIIEATKTFQKKPKPLYFQENQDRYKKYAHKIIHVVVDKYPTFFTRFRKTKTWDFENSQREHIFKGIAGAEPDDLIIISDIDEFPLPEKILAYKSKPGVRVFEQYLSFYYFNNVCTHLTVLCDDVYSIQNKNGYGLWRGSVMMEKHLIKSIKAARLTRELPDSKVTVIPEGGWHFSYMGGVDQILKKLDSWSHKELNKPKYRNKEHILKSIYEGRSIFDPQITFKVEDLNGPLPFPKTLIKNLENYSKMVLPP